jgi:hypothetical protein
VQVIEGFDKLLCDALNFGLGQLTIVLENLKELSLRTPRRETSTGAAERETFPEIRGIPPHLRILRDDAELAIRLEVVEHQNDVLVVHLTENCNLLRMPRENTGRRE